MLRPFAIAHRFLGLASWAMVVVTSMVGIATDAPAAHAAEATRVVSGGEKDNLVDLNLTVGFLSEQRRAALRREQAGPTGTTLGRDLLYKRQRNLVYVGGALGLLPNLGLTFNLPFVVSDQRTLDFDRVAAGNSSLLRDGILPGAGGNAYGLNAGTGQPFASPSSRVFAGPNRSGLEYLGAGMTWAVFDQAKVPTDPTWILGFETRFSLSDQRFDPANPSANTHVGPGFHQLVFSMAASRAFGRIEPFMTGFYMLPIKKSGGPFDVPGLGGNAYGNPQQVGGVDVGLQLLLWEDRQSPDRWRVTLEGRLRSEVRFGGLAQSELWEVLSGRSTCVDDPAACRAGLDRRDVDGSGVLQSDPHSGITRSPTYGIFAGDLSLNLIAARHTRLRALGGLAVEQSRFLTDGRSDYLLIDAPGRRFRVEQARGAYFLVEGGLLF